MEHLFKLKKDGKCVGLMKIENGEVYIQKPKDKYWDFQYVSSRSKPEANIIIKFDTAHLFVTKDKHGKDVFAGDKIISSDGLRKYKVTWDERRCRWWLCGIEKPWAVNEPVWENYELIEGKENV